MAELMTDCGSYQKTPLDVSLKPDVQLDAAVQHLSSLSVAPGPPPVAEADICSDSSAPGEKSELQISTELLLALKDCIISQENQLTAVIDNQKVLLEALELISAQPHPETVAGLQARVAKSRDYLGRVRALKEKSVVIEKRLVSLKQRAVTLQSRCERSIARRREEQDRLREFEKQISAQPKK